jgi:NADPH-dependent 2,4-dienoyl-CoA reductase/sulfur reductase-like enzyme
MNSYPFRAMVHRDEGDVMPAATVAARASETTIGSTAQKVDVAVVGAGFAGLYLLHRLRKAGFVR